MRTHSPRVFGTNDTHHQLTRRKELGYSFILSKKEFLNTSISLFHQYLIHSLIIFKIPNTYQISLSSVSLQYILQVIFVLKLRPFL